MPKGDGKQLHKLPDPPVFETWDVLKSVATRSGEPSCSIEFSTLPVASWSNEGENLFQVD
jgi:hypothetical protein